MALAIEYEKADQRRHHRVTAPLFVTLNKKQYRAVDWSIGGLRLEGISSTLPKVGDLVSVEITLPYQDFKITFDAEIEIVRHVEGKEGFGAKFTVLGEREQSLMIHFIDEIVRGTMTDVKETIARMDVPLTPVSIKPPANPSGKVPLHRWTSKEYVVPALYGLLGLLVFGYAAFVAYANIFHLVVETAVIGGRVGIVKAQSDGEIVYKGVVIGQRVKQGTVIAQISDPVLEARIGKASIEVRRKQAELTFLQQQTGVASSRSKEILTQKSGSLKDQRQRVRSISVQVRQAKVKYDRLRRKRRRAKRQRIQNARLNLSKLRKRLAKARSVLQGRQQLSRGNRNRGRAGGKPVTGNESVYQARLAFMEKQIELAQHDHQTLLKLRAGQELKAPYDARIVDLPKYSNSTIMRGDVLAVFEPTGSNAVTAFLTQEEILKVKIGDKASVYVPALDKSIDAHIKSINRRFSFVNSKDERYTWRPKEQRNAEVVLEIASGDLDKAHGLTTGLPAVIMFRDRDTNYILSYFLPGFFKSKV